MGPHLPLEADGPHPSLGDAQEVFAPFIGSWDLDVTWYEGDEVVRREEGEWHFAWVLEGRAVQDVWIVPRRGLREQVAEPYEYGTSLRFYDAGVDAWRSTWVGPTQRLVRTFVARRVGGEVVLDTRLDDGRRVRWAFADITADSFTWSNATEEGGRWSVTQRFVARRA
jgi:hypothetical protein